MSPTSREVFAERCRTAVHQLRNVLLTSLRPLLAGARRVALLDFPEYGNVGDSAIWLGALRALRDCHSRVAYVAGMSTYDPVILRRRVGRDGLVLLSGGGNFGDLWPVVQRFRERVVDECRDLPILQLPQSLHFQDAQNLERCRAVLNRHERLTLLLRDKPSLRLAQEVFAAPARLCPDLAFALGPLPRPAPPDRDIVFLSRRDREAPGLAGPDEVERVDWVDDPPDWAAVAGRYVRRLSRAFPIAGGPADLWWMRARAASRLRRGCRILSGGRVVVTNRLHGHVMCVLLGQLHFVSDTAQGKLGAFHDTWLRDRLPGIWCASEAEALARARAALAPDPSPLD